MTEVMTLRQQFDDMTRMLSETDVIGGEEEFIEFVVESTKLKDETVRVEEKISKLKKIAARKEREVAQLRLKVQRESNKLAEKVKKIELAQKEREAMKKVLENVQRAVMGHNTSSADLLSMIDSLSISDTTTH